MPDAVGRLRQLVGSHTAGGHWDDGAPMSVHQVLGEATVGELADAVHADQIAPLQAERDKWRRRAELAADKFGESTIREDTARAALAEIRDRHQRHGDRCGACDDHRLPGRADLCDACDTPHPCWHWRTADAVLTGGKEAERDV